MQVALTAEHLLFAIQVEREDSYRIDAAPEGFLTRGHIWVQQPFWIKQRALRALGYSAPTG